MFLLQNCPRVERKMGSDAGVGPLERMKGTGAYDGQNVYLKIGKV